MATDSVASPAPAPGNGDTLAPELHIGLASDVGSVRETNQDFVEYFVPEDEEQRRQKGALFLVADGMGGHSAGEVASQEAVEWVKEEYYTDLALDVGASLVRAYEKANRFLYGMAQADPSKLGMGTTLVAAVIQGTPPHVTIANVGDSRAYLLNEDHLKQITTDHSLVEELIQTGHLTPKQAETYPQRSVITRAVGTKETVEVDLFDVELPEGAHLLLCTDGLTNEVTDQQIARIARSQPPEEAAAQLVERANAGGGNDNISVLIVQARRPPSPGPARGWLASKAKIVEESDTGRRRQVAVFAAVAILLFLCIIVVGFLMANQGLLGGPAGAPHLAPPRLEAGDETGELAEATAPALPWRARPGVFLVGLVRQWRCEGQDCTFGLNVGGKTYRVSIDREHLVGNRTSLDGRQVRVFGYQPTDAEVHARLIDLGERWWIWWRPAWVTAYQDHDWSETAWVYTILDNNPYGMIEVGDLPGLKRGTPLLVQGRWLEGGPQDNMAFALERAYHLQGDEYVLVADDLLPVLPPTVTLAPTGTVTND